MTIAKAKQKGTSYEDIFKKVPLGKENSESGRYIWENHFGPSLISYTSFNRIIKKMSEAGMIKSRKSGVSFLYWKETEKFPEDVYI